MPVRLNLMATVLPLTNLPTPPIWSNILAITGSSSLGSYVRHLATDTGAAGAAAVTARANGAPARQAPPKMDADFSHSRRV